MTAGQFARRSQSGESLGSQGSSPGFGDDDDDFAESAEEEEQGELAQTLSQIDRENVSGVLQKLDSIRQLAGDAQVLRRKEVKEQNNRRLQIAQLYSLLLEEAEFNPSSVHQRNVKDMLEGIMQQSSEIFFFSNEEMRRKLATGPSVRLRDVVNRPHRYAERLLVDSEVLSRMLVEVSTPHILDIVTKYTEYLAFKRTTYQLKAIEEHNNSHIKNASGLAIYKSCIYVADTMSHCIWRVSAKSFTAEGKNKVELFAGSVMKSGMKDGPCLQALFHGPMGIVICERSDRAFVADTDNNTIRAIDLKEEMVYNIKLALAPSPGAQQLQQPKGVCIIHGNDVMFSEMEACQQRQREEFQAQCKVAAAAKATRAQSHLEESSTSESADTSTSSSFGEDDESSSYEASSSESSRSPITAPTEAWTIARSDVHTSASAGVQSIGPQSTGNNSDDAKLYELMSLEQSLSFQHMRKYSVLQDTGQLFAQKMKHHDDGRGSPKGRISPLRCISPKKASPVKKLATAPHSEAASMAGSRRVSCVQTLRAEEEDVHEEIRLAVTSDHSVWFVNPVTGSAWCIAGSSEQYGFNDSSLGLAARFSSPRGLINVRSVLFLADYWNDVVRCVNLYTTQVDTVLSFNPEGPTSISISNSGVMYVLDSNRIHFTNMLRIMSMPSGAQAAERREDKLSEFAREDKLWYQSLFEFPRPRSHSIVSESNTSEVWDTIKRKNVKVHENGGFQSAVFNASDEAERDPDGVYMPDSSDPLSEDFSNRLQAYLQQEAETRDEQEGARAAKKQTKKAKKQRRRQRRLHKRQIRNKDSTGKGNGEDPEDKMYIDPRLRQGGSGPADNQMPAIQVQVHKPTTGPAGEADAGKDLGLALQDRLEHLQEAPEPELSSHEKSDTDVVIGQEETRTINLDVQADHPTSMHSAPITRVQSPHQKANTLSRPKKEKTTRSWGGTPERSKSPDDHEAKTVDYVERTKNELRRQMVSDQRRKSLCLPGDLTAQPPVTLSDLGIDNKYASAAGSRRGSYSAGSGPLGGSSYMNRTMDENGLDLGMLSGQSYVHRGPQGGDQKHITTCTFQEGGQDEEAISPDAGTVIVSRGKAFYKASSGSGWSDHKSTAASAQGSVVGSRRSSSVNEITAMNRTQFTGEDEDGVTVTMVDLTANNLSRASPTRGQDSQGNSRRDSVQHVQWESRRSSITLSSRRSSIAHANSNQRSGLSGSRRGSFLGGASPRRLSSAASCFTGIHDQEPAPKEVRRASEASAMSMRQNQRRSSLGLLSVQTQNDNSNFIDTKRVSQLRRASLLPTLYDVHEPEEDAEENDKKNSSSNSSDYSKPSRATSAVVGDVEEVSQRKPSHDEGTKEALRQEQMDGLKEMETKSEKESQAESKERCWQDASESSAEGQRTNQTTPDSFGTDTNTRRDMMVAVTDAAPQQEEGFDSVLQREESVTRIMGLSQITFTRNIDIENLTSEPSAQNFASGLAPAQQLERQSSTLEQDNIGRRRTTFLSTNQNRGKQVSKNSSKIWRQMPLPELLSSALRTGPRYPNTPLSVAWYEEDDDCFLFVGLLFTPTLIKVIPPKMHEPDKGGRFNTLPIDNLRFLLADETCHQIWLVNHSDKLKKHLAGCGKCGYLDGPLEICQMNSPCSMALDPRTHHIYVADKGNHTIRKIDLLSGLMSTVVANGCRGNSDGYDCRRQALDSPFEVSFARPHYLIISCADNSIRSFNLQTGLLQTLLVGS
mmetsp:Transcript_113192/g.252781  ORF Transcript_113192/g.252781 Transcript_113192/m.252781 type:complete len:1732 (-) Transcript_113192:93-5288(-)